MCSVTAGERPAHWGYLVYSLGYRCCGGAYPLTEAFLVAEREPPAEASAIGSAGRDAALLPCALRGQRALLGAGAKFVVAVGGCGHGGSIAVLAIRQ